MEQSPIGTPAQTASASLPTTGKCWWAMFEITPPTIDLKSSKWTVWLSDIRTIEGGGLHGDVMIFCDCQPDSASISYKYKGAKSHKETLQLLMVERGWNNIWKYQFKLLGNDRAGDSIEFNIKFSRNGKIYEDNAGRNYELNYRQAAVTL